MLHTKKPVEQKATDSHDSFVRQPNGLRLDHTPADAGYAPVAPLRYQPLWTRYAGWKTNGQGDMTSLVTLSTSLTTNMTVILRHVGHASQAAPEHRNRKAWLFAKAP